MLIWLLRDARSVNILQPALIMGTWPIKWVQNTLQSFSQRFPSEVCSLLIFYEMDYHLNHVSLFL
jgi:hypothetical protein